MELSQVLQALRNADAAGDTEAAKRLAEIANGMIQRQQARPATPETRAASGKGSTGTGSANDPQSLP